MSILTAIQSVAIRVIGRRPTSVFASTDKTVMELADLANDVARDIAASHDWQALTRIDTITGDGTATTFPLPDDYDRMVLGGGLIDPSSWFWGYCTIPSVTQWLYEESRGWQLTPGAWIIIGNEFNFVPAPGASAEAKYPYITRNIVRPASGDDKAEFTTDTDSFVLDERLLTLGLIWRWKEQKGLEYAEDMATYENALSQAQARDGGSRVIRDNGNHLPYHAVPAWPWELGS